MTAIEVLPRDAIPSIDDPEFGDEYFGDGSDDVIVFEEDSDVRAYPVRILDHHEIVNDVVDGQPIVVTWCPLCGSAVVYDRTVGGQTLEFGGAGKLVDSNLVMYDRETESEWKQAIGECIAGKFKGEQLSPVSSTRMSYDEFDSQYTNGLVLARPGGERVAPKATHDKGHSEEANDVFEFEDREFERREIDYTVNKFKEYFQRDGFGFSEFSGEGSSREWDQTEIDPKETVLGIEYNGEKLGVPYSTVQKVGGTTTVTIRSKKIVVFATEDTMHAFEHPGFEFGSVSTNSAIGDGTTWNLMTGHADDGRQLEPVPSLRMFAFAWQDANGSDSFYLGE